MALRNDKRGSMVRRGTFVLGGLLVMMAIGLGFAKLRDNNQNSQTAIGLPTFPVERGPLTISVTESGTVRPREQVILKNEVEGSTVILYLIEEGKQVKKGDLLVELDSSVLTEERVDQQIEVINAEAEYVNARETLEVTKNQAQADIDKADLDLLFARQDLVQYNEGEYPKLEKENKAKITLAEEELTNAQNSYEWSKKLFEEKYLSETELKKDELTAQKCKLDRDLATAELELLQNFTSKRQITEYEANAKQMAMALERTKRKASADVAQAEASLKAKEAEFNQEKDKLAKIERQIEKTRIVAPMDGTVIYATSTRSSFRGSEEPLDEGREVREREELIYLPTTASFNCEIKVHESSLEKINVGMPVRITIDALPGRFFPGRVFSIAPLPDAQSMYMNPDLKVYNTIITLDADTTELRNGMSCQAEIVIARYPDAVYVPIQAVMRVSGRPTAYVLHGGGYEARPVSIGLNNNRMVHITDGLKSGEIVLLAPPLAQAESREEDMPAIPDLPTGQASPTTESQRTLAPAAAITPSPDTTATSETSTGNRRDEGGPGGRFANMSEAEREAMRKRFESMSPEERESMRQRMRGSRGEGGGPRGGAEGGRP